MAKIFKAARGKIFAFVDEDVHWRVGTIVPYLLAPFEDAEVGAVASIQRSKAPDSMPTLGSREVHCAADGGCWCLSAQTLFIRPSPFQDQSFADAYTQEVIGRRIVNTADDVVLTGLVFDRGWKVSIQNIPKPKLPPTFLGTT
ncbi:hypothetical protein GB937_009434, partial [Aspergillus fischeri]